MFITDIRESFLRALPPSEGEVFQWTHPEKGPFKNDLQTHLWLRRGDPRRLVISISGVHGAEAFIGSRIQEKILQERGLLNKENPPTLLIVHNLNAFGSGWVRRVNHQNIDLNRNCWDTLPANSDFSSYLKWLSSRNSPEFWMRFMTVLPHAVRTGLREASGTVAKGQPLFPDALFFCGNEASFEIRQLQNFLIQHFSKIVPEKIAILDIHTGLGDYAHESLLADPEADPVLTKGIAESLQARIIEPGKEKGFYPAAGTLGLLFKRIFPKSKLCHVTQEFGTYPFMTVLRHLVFENSVWRDKGPQAPGRTDLLLETFFPQSQLWRDEITRLGVQRFRQLDNFI